MKEFTHVVRERSNRWLFTRVNSLSRVSFVDASSNSTSNCYPNYRRCCLEINATKRYLYFENSDFNVSTSSTNSPTSHLSNKSGGKSAKIKGLGLLRTSCMSSYFVFLEPIPLTVVSQKEPKAKIRASFSLPMSIFLPIFLQLASR